MTHLTLVSLLLLGTSVLAQDAPQIETPYGPVKGFTHTTHSGTDVSVFLGIRYAKAPDHIFRFEKPEPVEKWGPLVHHATKFRAACIPHHRQALTRENYSEDCLFLNIVTPQKKSEKPLPVLVFIHGGGFEIGDTEMYGYKSAAENFVTQDLIFVSIQYRLGVLGFFTTGDREMPGNYGLWDQTLALQFLNEVLPSFGGDPDQVTLMGHSAGSSSVSALLYSPHSDHLFQQAIELSGSVFAEYSMSEYVVDESKALAKAVGCAMTDTKKMKECMKERTADEILDGVAKIEGGRRHAHFLKFHPHFDRDFFPFEVEHMSRKAPKKKTIQGVTDMESGLFVVTLQDIEYFTGGIHISKDRWANYTRQDLFEFMTTGVVTEEEFGRKMGPFLHLLMEFYLDRDAPEHPDSKFYIQRYTELISDLQFNVPVYHEVELKRIHDWETYYYVIDYVSQATKNQEEPLHGAFHASELRFMFDFYGQESLPLSEDDAKYKKALLNSFIAFVKSGNPSTKDLAWPPVTNDHPARHMRFNENPKITDEHFRQEAMDFWLKTVPKAIGADILHKGRLPAATAHIRHTEL